MALVRDSIGGTVPIDLMIPFVGLVGVPLATTIAGRKQQQGNSPSLLPLSLFELFYAIEVPILAACVIRLFILRTAVPVLAITHSFGVWPEKTWTTVIWTRLR